MLHEKHERHEESASRLVVLRQTIIAYGTSKPGAGYAFFTRQAKHL